MQLQQSATIAVAHTANQASPKLVAQLESAIELARTGRKAEARAMVAFSAADAPQDVNVLHKAGVVLKLCGAYDEALPFFQQALAVRPNFHFTESEIAGLYADLGQLGEGLRWYRKTIASQPRWVLPYWRAAQLALQLGRSREGLELLESACDRPDQPGIASAACPVSGLYEPARRSGQRLRAAARQRSGKRRRACQLSDAAERNREASASDRALCHIEPGARFASLFARPHARRERQACRAP